MAPAHHAWISEPRPRREHNGFRLQLTRLRAESPAYGLKLCLGAENVSLPDAAAWVQVMPLFPLGATVYTPFTEHRLNIFEPRYRT